MELDRRAARVTKADLNASATPPVTLSNLTDDEAIASTTRYSYYRKKKVIQYINFINNKYFADNIAELSSSQYFIDPNLIALSSGTSTNFVIVKT